MARCSRCPSKAVITSAIVYVCMPMVSLSDGVGQFNLRRKMAPWEPMSVDLPPGLSNRNKDDGRPTSDPSSVECTVHYAVGHAEKDGDLPQEILHCLLDEPDENGSLLYEIQGLESHEFAHIRDVVSHGNFPHVFEFPSVTKSRGAKPASIAHMPNGEETVVEEPTSPTIHVGKKDDFKFQAIEKSSKRRKNYNEAMGAEIPEGEENDTRRQRSLSKHQGISTILAVRTKALDGETSHSPNQCRARTFGGIDDDEFLDDLNVKSQIDACSYGKLNFVPPEDDAAYPAVQGGVVTVVLNKSVVGVSHGTVLDWLLVETPKVAGDLGRYDHVMFFMPDGVVFGGAAAFGYSPGKYTWYMDGYSLATGIQMHELGHNLGLGHSGEDGATYGDSSCYMGYGGFDVKMCYNAAKSWYLNWYSELKQEYDVLKDSARVYKIVGLADYDEALTASASDTSYAVVLKINTYESDNLFLTYNRREKMNEGTKEFEDKLTIVLSDGPSQSWAMAGLNPGQKYTTPVIPGSGIMLEIIVCERVFGYPDHMVVSVGKYGEEEQLCTPQSPIPSWETYSGKLTDGLIGYYNFDADFNDFSGFKHHGVAFGGPSLIADGMFGSALSFDGVDDFIELPSSTSLEFGTGDFTLTFWYRVDGDQSGSPAILGNKDWNSGMNPGWVVSSNYGPGSNGDDLAINLADGISRSDASNAMDVDFGSWHFVAVRVKRGDKMSLLRSIGGSYDIQEDDISSLSGSINSGLPIRIGTSHGYLEFTKMDLDDLGVWNRALSSEEVDAIYFAGRMYSKNLLEAFDPPPLPPIEDMPSTIIAKYEFENTLLDTSGNNLHGIFERGEGFSFQGTPDGLHLNLANADSLTKTYVSLPESGLLDFGSAADFTISFWQRTSDDSANDPSIISNKNWQSGINPGWTIGIGDDGRLEFNVGDGSNRCDFDGPSGAMTDGEWHHVSFSLTRGPVGVMTIFMDGTQLSKKTCALNTVSSGYSIKIGTDGTGGSSYPAFFDGDVDKVFIFGSALSHANVFLLFAEGRGMEGTLPPTKPPTTQPTMQPTTRPPTFSPTKKPTACPAAMPQECGCDEVQQSDYRGNISVTISGVQCQPWASQTPHSHTRTPENYPNSGLESNYCRNPDGEPSTWCYTIGSTRWDYCDVPVCSSAPPTKFPTPSPENDNSPTLEPSKQPTKSPLLDPAPTLHPTPASVPNTKPPTNEPTRAPMSQLSFSPSWLPSSSPTLSPTSNPTIAPTAKPTLFPTGKPTAKPTSSPSSPPSLSPTSMPTAKPTQPPSNAPTKQPTVPPSSHPTSSPTKKPTRAPTIKPTVAPSTKPTAKPVTTPPPTNQPTSDPACPGAMPQECGCSEVQQSDYRGNISVTISGVQCQPWAAQTPHAHTRTPENYPDSGLESNYCRNPDGEPRAWCYTVGSTRWEYCDVPSCRPCLGANSEICGCQEVMQSDYRGTIATTVDGEECQPWSSQTPHTHTRTPENYPLSGLDSNYCRNPDGEEKAWCYTTSSVRWNWCNVPNCIEQA